MSSAGQTPFRRGVLWRAIGADGAQVYNQDRDHRWRFCGGE
jgi:hypothetical protein